ncbi:hypothetical protein EJB05_15539, partial [Eragrostis curvula]
MEQFEMLATKGELIWIVTTNGEALTDKARCSNHVRKREKENLGDVSEDDGKLLCIHLSYH